MTASPTRRAAAARQTLAGLMELYGCDPETLVSITLNASGSVAIKRLVLHESGRRLYVPFTYPPEPVTETVIR